MLRTDLFGRDATDPEVQAAVLKSIREMPFRDLVAAIEGEDAAIQMEPASAAAATDAIRVNSAKVARGIGAASRGRAARREEAQPGVLPGTKRQK